MIPRLVRDAICNKWHMEESSSQADLDMVQEKINHLQLSANQCLKNHGSEQEKEISSDRQLRIANAQVVAQNEELLVHLVAHDKSLAALDKKPVALDQSLVARNNLPRMRNRRLAEFRQRNHWQNLELIRFSRQFWKDGTSRKELASGTDNLAAVNLAAANLSATRSAAPKSE